MAVQILKASEDYLETMLMMQTKHGYVRSVDVAEHLGVTKPSVTYATKRLRENGYIEMDKDGLITLTDAGMQIASKMLQAPDPDPFSGEFGRGAGDRGGGCLQNGA